MKTETKVYIGSGVLVVGGLIALVMKNKADKGNENSSEFSVQSAANGGTLQPKATSISFPLKFKSGYNNALDNLAVKNLQIALNKRSGVLPKIKVDGKFGNNTKLRLLALFRTSEVSKVMYETKIIAA